MPTLEDGTYRIELVSRDILHRSGQATQPNETWSVEFLDASGKVIAKTGPTEDLTDSETLHTTALSDPVLLNGAITARAVIGGGDSIQPLAVFIRPTTCVNGQTELVTLSEQKKLLGFYNPQANSLPPISVESRSGEYRVFLESGDDEHADPTAPDQNGESWFLEGLGKDGSVLFKTSPSDELLHRRLGNVTEVGSYDMTGVVELRARHAAVTSNPSSVYALSVILIPGATVTDPGDDPDGLLFEDDRLRITYSPQSAGGTTYEAEIQIENRSSNAIDNWHLLFETDDRVTAVDGANLTSQTGREVIIEPRSGTASIPAGGSSRFVFTATITNPPAPNTPDWAVLLEGGLLPADDSDGDGIPDYIEIAAGMNPNAADSDGDGLNDDVEWQVRLDPLSADSNGDGTADGDEDLDADGLTNAEEAALGTGLLNADTDQDVLDDGDEVARSTDPLNPDTDGDGVEDGTEVELGTDPRTPETSFAVTRKADGDQTSPSVSIEGLEPGQVETFNIIPLPEDHQRLSAETPGYVDNGYEFVIGGTFQEAEVSFSFDPALQGPDFDPAIYTYDDELQLLVEVENQVVSGNTVTATITNFSEYILLNRTEFDRVWEFEFLEIPDDQPFERYDVVFVIDSSGSMTTNDPTNERVAVVRDFVDQLGGLSRAGIVDFNGDAVVLSRLTSDKAALNSALGQIDSSGNTSLSVGVTAGLELLEESPGALPDAFKTIVLLTDGAGPYDPALTARAADQDIVMYTIGLGAGVDVGLLTSIATGTGGRYFPVAQADELDEVFSSITDLVDLFQDSDSDGIVDYFEKQMRAGNLRIGTGEPLSRMDPFDPDSDDDGLSDGDELEIRRTTVRGRERVYAFLTSDPQIPDSDGDGLDDPVDPLPLVFNPRDMLIHQSANREGRRKEPDLSNFQVPPSRLVADDLTYNDYTGGELRDLGAIFFVAPITPEFLMWAEFDSILGVGKNGAGADHRATVDGLRNLFRNGNDGNSSPPVEVTDNYDPGNHNFYSSGAMNRAVRDSDEMQEYLNTATEIIVNSIESNDGSIDHLQVDDDLNKNFLYQRFDQIRIYPVWDFSVRDANERALSIAIHQFHGHTISLKDYEVTNGGFTGTLVFHSYDHFGLDPDDEITEFGFVDWFTLQHYDRFDGKYTPPLAVVDIEIPIRGTF